MTCQGFIGKADERFWRIAMSENAKLQITNIKWFDKPFGRLTVLSQVEGLTTLSQVEGQITMTNPPPADQSCFSPWVLALWNFALGEPAEGRIPQGKNLKFVCNLVLGI